MAGTYLEGSSKVLSGVYTLIKAAISAVTLGSRGIVAYPFTANWGPVNTITPVLYGSEFDKLFNPTNDANLTAKKISVHAFKGKPQQVLCYRMATGAAALGVCTLNGAGEVLSLELKTRYKSARAFMAVVADAVGGGKKVQITEGGVVLAEVTGATVEELETKLNATDYVDVTNKGAVLPSNSAGTNFVGGNNGTPATATEYAAFLAAIEADGRPNAFSLDAVTDEALLTTAETWVKRVRDEGLYITWARGGPVGWDTAPADADTKSKAINHRGVVNVGNGVDGYTAAEMAIFIAARVASIALNRTVTDEVIDYVTVNKKLTPGQRVTAKEAGTLVFVHGTSGKVEIDEGINTLTVPHTDEVAEMGKIRVNNALDQICKDTEAFGDEYKKTRSNTQAARELYAATVEKSYFGPLETLEVVQPGATYRPDPEYHGKDAVFTPKLDEAFFLADYKLVDSMERIYQKMKVSF